MKIKRKKVKMKIALIWFEYSVTD